jgi:hypothetical protein
MGEADFADHRVQFTRADVVGPVVRDFLDRHSTSAPGTALAG